MWPPPNQVPQTRSPNREQHTNASNRPPNADDVWRHGSMIKENPFSTLPSSAWKCLRNGILTLALTWNRQKKSEWMSQKLDCLDCFCGITSNPSSCLPMSIATFFQLTISAVSACWVSVQARALHARPLDITPAHWEKWGCGLGGPLPP